MQARSNKYHKNLAEYFNSKEYFLDSVEDMIVSAVNVRKVGELPWQLAEAHEWPKLYDLLADTTFLKASWQLNQVASQFELSRFWAIVDEASTYRMIDAYKPVIENPILVKDPNTLYQMAALLRDSGRVKSAMPLILHLIDRCKKNLSAHPEETTQFLVILGSFLWDAGEINEVFALNVDLIKLCRKIGFRRGQAVILVNQASIFRDRGELYRALRLLEEAAAIFRSLGAKAELADCLGKRAEIHTMLREFDQSSTLLDEMEMIDRTISNHSGLAHSLNARGVISLCQGHLDQAFQLHRDEEKLCRSQGDRVGLQRALGSQALVRTLQDRLDEALSLADEAISVCEDIESKMGLAYCHGVRGRILRMLGRYDEARAAQRMEEALARELGAVSLIAVSLAEQANTARAAGNLEDADLLMAKSKQLLSESDLRSFMDSPYKRE